MQYHLNTLWRSACVAGTRCLTLLKSAEIVQIATAATVRELLTRARLRVVPVACSERRAGTDDL